MNTAKPSSTSARAVARQTETYDTSVFEVRTTLTRCGAENLVIGTRLTQSTAGSPPMVR